MRVDCAVAALRSDPAPQRRAQAAMVAACDAWRAAPEAAKALAELERYGAGGPLTACPALLTLLTDGASAPRFVAALVCALCRTLAGEPFGHPALRHGFDRGVATLLLARSGRAHLVLRACEPGRHSFDSVHFADAERHEAVLAGLAHARIVRRRSPTGGFAESPLTLRPGVRVALDLTGQALQVLQVERRLVSLRLHRAASEPHPTREYALADGAFRHQSAGNMRTSRHEAMLALLGRMGCAEAAPVMAAMAREPGDSSLRWQALRECLALDTAEGFRALDEVARSADDPLAAPAEVLCAQLLEAHPQLAALEDGRWPA